MTLRVPLFGEPADPPAPDRPIGFGRLRRKEDGRFIRGQGKYVDDLQLPGMLHGAILRSPFAHARIVSIDPTAALQHPRVHAVLTGADLETRGVAWIVSLPLTRSYSATAPHVSIGAGCERGKSIRCSTTTSAALNTRSVAARSPDSQSKIRLSG